MLTIPADQFSQLRRNALAKALAETFEGTRQSARVEPESGDVLATDPRGHSLRFGFDLQGFIGRVTSPLGRTWRLDNGPRGRLEGLTAPSGLRLDLGYDAEGRATSIRQDEAKVLDFDYDAYGNLAGIGYADGTETRLDYWGPGRLTEKVDRLGRVERYGYDEIGRLTAITDANGHTTSFEYGDWDRPDRAHFPDGRVETYAYDAQGRTTRIASKSGRSVELAYDGDGLQPVRVAYEDGEVLEFVYDDQGRILEARNPEAVARYTYDTDGRVVREEVTGQVVTYRYDAAGSLVGLTYPGGETVRFGYDADLRLDSVEDWNGGVCRWGYDQVDRAYAVEYPGGLTTHAWQTPTGQVEATDILAPDGQRVFATRYAYDAEGRLSHSIDKELGRRAYRYDAEGQLVGVEADRPERSEHFAYDAAGNRIACGDETADFDAGNRLLRQGEIRCTYDIHGDLAVMQTPERDWRYTWSSRGMLVRAESSDGRVVSFGYDAFGRRLWKRALGCGGGGERETRFHWAGEHMVGEEVWEDGALIRRQEYLYWPGTYTPLATRVDGAVFYYQCDHLGTPRRLMDGRGRVVWAAEYAAFGEATVLIEEVGNWLRFPGQYWDDETGLCYNRFRYYSAGLGRYLSSDPLRYASSLNLYAYGAGNPVNNTDPFGLIAFLAVFAVIAIVGAVIGGINAALSQESFCWTCIESWKKVFWGALKGAVIALVAASPFVWLEAVAAGTVISLSTYIATGAFSGAIAYHAEQIWDNIVSGGRAVWNWGDFAYTIVTSALTAGIFGMLSRSMPKGLQDSAPGGPANRARSAQQLEKPPAAVEAQKRLPAGPEGPKQLPPGPEPPKQLPAETQTTQDALKRGALRAQTHGSQWEKASLKDTVKQVVGEDPVIERQGAKTIYRNPDTGKQVVHDRGGDYYRVEDTTLPGKRRYLGKTGERIPDNRLEQKPDGTAREVGKTPAEYNKETHFLNSDEEL